jgi:ribosome-associated heat shock protein Hsp15
VGRHRLRLPVAVAPGHAGAIDSTRVDKWLWAIRIYKTRSAATDACTGGHVKVNGSTAKPAAMVRVGDRVEAFAGGRQRELEVVRIIEKRVGAPVAAECVVDHSPPPPPREARLEPLFSRERGSGRPTKRERRALDRFRER